MPVEKSVKEVQEILNSPKSNSLKRPIIYGDKIDALEKGAGILIAANEWKLKTPIANYYYSKYNKKGVKIVGCRKEDGGTLVYKL